MTASLYGGTLYRFQAELVAEAYLRPRSIAVVDTGLGKTHIALALSALLIEDGVIDRVMVMCEGNKVDEWMDDIAEFTSFSAVKYRGTKDRRRRIVGKLDGVHSIVSTYHTFREDLVVSPKTLEPDFLTEAMVGQRLLVIYDEATLLGGRTSALHQVHRNFAHSLGARIIGLTATPVTNGPESFYNLGRIFCPDLVGTVDQFHREHVVRFDKFHNPSQFRNLDLLAEKMSPVLLRKRKTDPDVVAQFPTVVEDPVKVRLSPDHQRVYDILKQIVEDKDEDTQAMCFNLMRTFANHPASILSSTSAIATELLEAVSASEIEGLSCSKSEAVVRKLTAIVRQGDQAVMFCDSVTVLEELRRDLAKAGIEVAMYHGGLSDDSREQAKASFKSGNHRVLLASSAAERGVNLPEASYIINYDVPRQHASYIQRLSRASRIGSNAGETLFVVTYVATGTVEEGAVQAFLRRNRESDQLIDFDVELDDDNFTSASHRRRLIQEAGKRIS